MQITMNIILDLISQYDPEVYMDDISAKTAFTGILLLDTVSNETDPQYLYVCTLSEAIRYAARHPEIYYLCLRDRLPDEMETTEVLSHMVVVGKNVGLPMLFNLIQGYFIKLENWENRMQDSLLNKEGLQALMNNCELICENHITVYTPTLRILAHTGNIGVDNPKRRELLEAGSHSEESIQEFIEYRRFEAWMETEGIFVTNNPPDLADRTILGKAFKTKGIIVMVVTMYCNNRPITPGLVDLYQLILDKIAVYIEHDYQPLEAAFWGYSHFIGDLINAQDLKEDFVRSRAVNVGLDFNMCFYLFKIVFNDPQNMLHLQVSWEFANYMPTSKPVLFNKELLMLNICTCNSKEGRESFIQGSVKQLEPLLRKYNTSCGISDLCETLMQVNLGYRQASAALTAGNQITSKKILTTEFGIERVYDELVFQYHDYYIYDMIYSWETATRLNTPYQNALKLLLKYDRKHNTDNMRLLYYYLQNERKATETAETLQMHRNNILYRVKKIESLLEIDLDDAETRYRILLEFHRLELTEIS